MMHHEGAQTHEDGARHNYQGESGCLDEVRGQERDGSPRHGEGRVRVRKPRFLSRICDGGECLNPHEDEEEGVPSQGDVDSHRGAERDEDDASVEHSSPGDLEVGGELLLAGSDIDVMRTDDEAEESREESVEIDLKIETRGE